MVQLSSQYDKEVGKIFYMRGDEAYARTTDCRVKALTDSSSTQDFNNYRIGLQTNVYRDKGESKITLYDGDTVLNQYDWSQDTEEMYIGMNNDHTAIDPTTCLELAYGVPHEIYIRYKGNSSCLPSKSKVLEIYEPLPEEFETNIGIVANIDDNDVTAIVTLNINGVATSGTHDTDIEMYLDGSLVDTINTEDDNVASLTMNDISEGIHTITATVIGDDTIHTATSYTEVVIGYKVEIIQYPHPFVKGKDNDFAISVKSYDGTPMSNVDVLFNDTAYTTNTDGIAEFTLRFLTYGEHTASYNGVESDPIFIEILNPHISISASNGIVSKGRTDTLTLSLKDATGEPVKYEGYEITLTKRYRGIPASQSYISKETLYSDSNGIATKTITGGEYEQYGTGLFSYDSQSNVNTSDVTVDVDDVIYCHLGNQKWEADSLTIENGYSEENNKGLLVKSNNNLDPVISFKGNKGNSWNISFRVSVYSLDGIIAVDVGQGNYYRLEDTSPVISSDCRVELKYSNRTLEIYTDGYKVNTVTNCDSTGAIKVMNTAGSNVSVSALFYNLKLVRV